MRLALCQMNATVGDIAGNVEKMLVSIEDARRAGAHVALFPELALTGYPPEDLLLREHFLADVSSALSDFASEVHGIIAVLGFPERSEDVYNSAAIISDGAVHAVCRKVYLPNYGVFDEQRYFQAGQSGAVIDIGSQRVGVTVCEDIWEPGPPASEQALAGATLILNISASPYHAGKGAERERMLAQRARDNLACVAFCAMVGGQDELVFDGHSCVIDHTGQTIARAAQFEEELLICDVDTTAASAARLKETGHRPLARHPRPHVHTLPALASPLVSDRAAELEHAAPHEPLSPVQAEVYAALTLGLGDYVEKNGFDRVVLGLSGGIDSALVACLATDTLGSERVSVVIMPSPYSSGETQDDARLLAASLGVRVHELAISQTMDAYNETLSGEFAGLTPDLTEENLQARIRGNLLMALSNKFGWLVLTTGNKSEMSVGYTTLYGDLAGGFAVIKDVPKTLVYELCQWRNSPDTAAGGLVDRPIPSSIIERAPSAELREGQRDDDSLPPYELLDRILHAYIELDHGRDQLIASGLPAAEVDLTIRLVDLAEYKRRQAPPGIKISTRAFGRDRRMPITNAYRG
jgi:NAD+ synthase (glutamine-hydrolysing)